MKSKKSEEWHLYTVHVHVHAYITVDLNPADWAASVAQLAEHWTSNPVVTGSNPIRGSSVFFTVCLRTLPYMYLLSLVLICIYMYEIDHVYIYTCWVHVHVQYMYMYMYMYNTAYALIPPLVIPPSLPPSLPPSPLPGPPGNPERAPQDGAWLHFQPRFRGRIL